MADVITKEQVFGWYLSADLNEIEGAQEFIKVIYDHRKANSHSEKIKAGKAAAKLSGGGKGKGKGKGKKGDSTQVEVTSGEINIGGGFGSKEVVDEPVPTEATT